MSASADKIAEISEGLLSIERLGVDYLYDLEHAQNNLFFMGCDNTSDAQFRISSVSLPAQTMSFERNNNRGISISSIEPGEEITVNWIEDAYRSVENFHLQWMRQWYDFGADCIPIGSGGKYKTFTILVYHYINKNKTGGAPVVQPDPVLKVILEGCVPNGLNSTELSWEGGGLKGYSATYKVSRIKYEYYGKGEELVGSKLHKQENSLMSQYAPIGFGDRRDLAKEGEGDPKYMKAEEAWPKELSAYTLQDGSPDNPNAANSTSSNVKGIPGVIASDT